MKNPLFTGSGVALVTPFANDGPDLKAYAELIRWQIAEGTDALIACGTTGEPSTMSDDEQEAVVACAIAEASGRVPVIAGIGGNNTAKVTAAAKKYKAMGADGLLAVTPYYNKTTQKGLVSHFNAVADAAELPVIVYNVPARTGLNMTAATYRKVADHPFIYGMKEASDDIKQISDMARLCPEVPLYSGNDDQILPILSLGGLGVISVAANIAPRMVHDLCAKWFAGDVAGAREIQFALSPLIKALFCETNPIPAKTALNLMGRNGGLLRLPLVEMEEANLDLLKREMAALGLL